MTRQTIACSMLALALSCGAAHASTTINAGGSSLAFPTYQAEFEKYTNSSPTILFSYSAVGSGSGQAGFLQNTFTPQPSTDTVWWPAPAGILTYGTPVGTQVDIGASDATLISGQLTNPSTGSYGTSTQGSVVDGPIIQIPTFGVPVTMAFNQPAITSLKLTANQVCGILSGQISDWNTLNPSIPSGTPITVVYRSDGSGTTFLTLQHLAEICNSSNSNFTSITVGNKFISDVVISGYTAGTLPPNFVPESGSGNVATEINSTSGAIGYLSPDYTSIAPNSSANPTVNYPNIIAASLVNSIDGKTYAPTVANTTLALANPDPDDSANTKPPANMSDAMDPLNWVPTIAVALKGYPIVGYTTMDLSSCYADAAAAKAIELFLKDQYTSTAYKNIIEANGFVPLVNSGAAKYATAVENTFLSNNVGYKLNINNSKLCKGLAGR